LGVWGTGVFSDDNAADLRGDYRRLLAQGLSGPEATDRLLEEWAPVGDPDLEPVFWLDLAVTQWKSGRLEQRVKEAALRVIDNGSAIQPWVGSKFEPKRQAVLEAVRQQLNSPQPAPTRIRKAVLATCDWKRGDLIAYRLASATFVVFRMLSVHTDQGGSYPECEVFDWRGPEPPREGLPPSTPIRGAAKNGNTDRMMILPLGKAKVRDKLIREGRLLPLGVRHELAESYSNPRKARVLPTRVILDLDRQLYEFYGLA